MQAGIGSRRPSHMLTHSMRYLLPHSHVHANLDSISAALAPFDIVALQEADAGSFRSHFIHQQEYIAMRAGFDYSHSLTTREIGPLACMTLGLLAKLPWTHVCEHRLPASRHGRAALEVGFQIKGQTIVVIATHLSLRKSSRVRQIRYLSSLINQHRSTIVMGDFNCAPGSREMEHLLNHTRLRSYDGEIPRTFPSWQPRRRLDHILVSGDLILQSVQSLPMLCSDHLPVAGEIRLK
ncbi:MAG: endonuclease/exonuclease/phosphatase family protein [Mariprofundaceae bacterium]